MSDVKLSCRHIWKVYGPRPESYFARAPADPSALARRMREEGHIPAAVDVSFDLHVGEIFVIMGLSGSGKSTLVRCLSRLVEPTWGEVLLDGEDLLRKPACELIEIRRHKMGMVFQNFGLIPHMTVAENVAFPLKLQRMDAAQARLRTAQVIHLVGLEGREESYPSELSGGQQQRVGIARSLAVEPALWFLDEPFSALDPLIRRQMQDEFMNLQSALKKSIVFITHDFLEALRIADRMMIIRGGETVQTGTPLDLVARPADKYVAEFTGDAPLARVLRAGEICDYRACPAEGLVRVDAAATVEEVLPRLAHNEAGLAVERDGETIGVLTAHSVVAALARSAADRSEQPVSAEAVP